MLKKAREVKSHHEEGKSEIKEVSEEHPHEEEHHADEPQGEDKQEVAVEVEAEI
jgi:hypothetical protein